MKPNIKIELNDYIPFEQLTPREKSCYEAGVKDGDWNVIQVLTVCLIMILLGAYVGATSAIDYINNTH